MRDAITVQNLGKRFNCFHAEKPVTLMEAALSGMRRIKPVKQFWALRHVSFTVAPGQMLGVIGHNGAGKSTLLQLIGGVGRADEGQVKVSGRIGALLDLGAGFHGDLTGRENVFVTAVVAGLTRRETARRLEAVVDFAELEDSIDNPVRTYSTGMIMRLAFSVAIHTTPQVLLVDEFLSVGDIRFQSKCIERIVQLKNDGCAIVFISHDAGQVERLCDCALWLQQGHVEAYGEPKVVAGQYASRMQRRTQALTPSHPDQLTASGTWLRINENRFGSLEMEIVNVLISPSTKVRSGDSLTVKIEYCCHQPVSAPIFNVTLTQADGQVCLDVNTGSMRVDTTGLSAQGCLKLHIDRLDLNSGDYLISVGVYEQNWSHAYDYHWQAYSLSVEAATTSQGMLNPPLRWEADHPSLVL